MSINKMSLNNGKEAIARICSFCDPMRSVAVFLQNGPRVMRCGMHSLTLFGTYFSFNEEWSNLEIHETNDFSIIFISGTCLNF